MTDLQRLQEAAITRAVRRADDRFEKSGGSSRHWVRDCFMDELEKEGLTIIPAERYSALVEAAEAMRHEASLHIVCEHAGQPTRVCRQLSCYPLCKAIDAYRAALKEVRP